MTVQTSETLIYEGQKLGMRTLPLDQFVAMGGTLPTFESDSTMLHRGYIGTWEIIGGRLYLTRISGFLANGWTAHLHDVFPDFLDRVFAHWYTGTLIAPQGERVNHHHDPYRPIREWDLLFEIERGHLTGTRVRDNRERVAALENSVITDRSGSA